MTNAQKRTLAAMTHPQHYKDHVMREDARIEVPEVADAGVLAHPLYGKGTHIFVEGGDPWEIPQPVAPEPESVAEPEPAKPKRKRGKRA